MSQIVVDLKLMRQLNRKRLDGKPMYKYLVSIPPKAIEELEWDKVQRKELTYKIKDKKLIIELS